MTGPDRQIGTPPDGVPLEAALADLESVVGDAAFVAELIDEFLSALPEQRATLREAAAADDAEQVHRIAHTLKANGATFGGSAFAAACRALEIAAKNGPPVDGALVARVDAEAARLTPQLEVARDLRAS